MQELGLEGGVMHCSSLAYGRHEEVLVAWQAIDEPAVLQSRNRL